MTQNDTEMDETTLESSPQKSQILQTLTTGPFSSSISNLSISSRAIPSDKDFHFYYNFDEFKLPIQEIAVKSQSLLESIGSSSSNQIFSEKLQFPIDADIDEAYDWLVNVNDEIFERFDSSIDEFRKIREETSGAVGMGTEDGFQLVYGKKNKKQQRSVKTLASGDLLGGDSGVKVADYKKGVLENKAKVPFHIPTIRRSQEEFNILVNNSNRAFEHVWLERSEDGSRVIHPLEKLSVLDFVDKTAGDVEPALPLLIECTPFKLVEEVKDLKELAAKLHSASEFAVDLEHNQYRSFQGLTCLMQISTRTEDFIVDTLKLRIHVGPYLREVFKDPSKRKVMHGADRDIVWLQRDFGIYVCNMFDTGQASRVLKLERNSLEYLLHHFCGVAAKKEYQNADWRLRPLPDEMLRYAREDTRYLLHIYDLMRGMLLSMPSDDENADPPLLQVYKRSYDVCMQLYEMELFTENSYLHIYGLHTTGFSAQQLAIVAGLYEWRDAIARAEDESTGYILPNKTLLEIAKEMPVTTSKLRRLLKSKHPYVERNLSSVVSIIRHSMQTSAAFETAVQYLKERQMEKKALQEDVEANDRGEAFSSLSVTSSEAASTEAKSIPAGNGMNGNVGAHHEASAQLVGPVKQESSISKLSRGGQGSSVKRNGENGGVKKESSSYISDTSPAAKVTGATVQALKKPSSGFAALLGGAATKKKLDTDKKVMEEIKLEKVRSSTNLSFHSFTGGNEPTKVPKPAAEEPNGVSEVSHPKESLDSVASDSRLEEIMMFGDGSDVEETAQIGEPDKATNADKDDKSSGSILETDNEIPVSLLDLSTSFQKCFQSNNQNRKAAADKSQEPRGLLQVKPFDYAAARKQVNFTVDAVTELEAGDDRNQRGLLDTAGNIKGSPGARVLKDDGTGEFKEGRRRQAFPATGNRSGTFR